MADHLIRLVHIVSVYNFEQVISDFHSIITATTHCIPPRRTFQCAINSFTQAFVAASRYA